MANISKEELLKQANELGVVIPEGAKYNDIVKIVAKAKADRTVKDEIKADDEAKAEEADKEKDPQSVYVGCKILGGIKIPITIDGETKNIILRSATEKSITPDGTVNFSVKPHEYGLTVLTAEEAKAVKDKIGGAKYVKKGFVFFADSKAEFDKCAVELGRLPNGAELKTGLEPLTVEDIQKTVDIFKRDE